MSDDGISSPIPLASPQETTPPVFDPTPMSEHVDSTHTSLNIPDEVTPLNHQLANKMDPPRFPDISSPQKWEDLASSLFSKKLIGSRGKDNTFVLSSDFSPLLCNNCSSPFKAQGSLPLTINDLLSGSLLFSDLSCMFEDKSSHRREAPVNFLNIVSLFRHADSPTPPDSSFGLIIRLDNNRGIF